MMSIKIHGGWLVSLGVVLFAGLWSEVSAEETNTVSREGVRILIGRLGDSSFAERNVSQQRLVQGAKDDPHVILDECVSVYANTADPEIKFRLRGIMSEIVENQILHKPQGYLGIRIMPMSTAGKNGAPLNAIQVVNALEKSAAARAGMKDGDAILKVDDLDINMNPSVQAFVWHVRSRKPRDIAKLEIRRGDEFLSLDVELDELPDDLKGELVANESARKAQFEEWLKERLDEEKRKRGQE